MRGRTNVLNFDEDFINADIVDAIADENILAGNFVNFRNAFNGGFNTLRYVDLVIKLSDDRIACVGRKANDPEFYVRIFNRNSSGEYTQSLPDIPTGIEIGSSYGSYNYSASRQMINLGDDKFAFYYYSTQSSTSTWNIPVYLNVVLFYIDVNTNELFTTVKNNINFNYLSVFDSVNRYKQSVEFTTDFIKESDTSYTLFASLSLKYATTSSGTVDKLDCCSFAIRVSINKGTVGSSNKFVNSSVTITHNINTLWLVSGMSSRVISPIYVIKSDLGNGYFVSCRYAHYQHRLYFVFYNDIQTSATVLSPVAINLFSSFSSQYDYVLPIGEYGDSNGNFAYFIFAKHTSSDAVSFNLYWFKIRMYTYSTTNPSYLVYNANLIEELPLRYANGLYSAYVPVNFAKLYENSNLIRFYFSMPYYYRSAVNYSIMVLIDINKNVDNPESSSEGITVNPKSTSIRENYIYDCALHEVIEVESEEKYTIVENGIIIDYSIVDDSELSGDVSEVRHVSNATDENYIMGVAKESGNSGDVVACYKAKVST